jgi:hypothetical protein
MNGKYTRRVLRWVKWIIAIVIMLAAVAWVMVGCKVKNGKLTEIKVNMIRARVAEEAEQLGKEHWAGSYYQGDGLGVNVSLDIAPKAGFAFEWHGCLGLYDRNYGTVTSDNGRLKLSFVLSNSREGFQGLAKEFLIVRWGQRIYLIETDKLYDFCDKINLGMEPRDEPHGMYLLRRGDHAIAVTGRPNLPEAYRPYLLDNPILAEVTKIVSSHKAGGFDEVTVEINAGQKQGVLPQMRFHPMDEFYISGTVTKVLDTSSIVVFQTIDLSETPAVGWKVATTSRYQMNKNRPEGDKDAK